jgi:hypothetical protein
VRWGPRWGLIYLRRRRSTRPGRTLPPPARGVVHEHPTRVKAIPLPRLYPSPSRHPPTRSAPGPRPLRSHNRCADFGHFPRPEPRLVHFGLSTMREPLPTPNPIHLPFDEGLAGPLPLSLSAGLHCLTGFTQFSTPLCRTSPNNPTCQLYALSRVQEKKKKKKKKKSHIYMLQNVMNFISSFHLLTILYHTARHDYRDL